MSAVDLSMPKALDLSVKNNDDYSHDYNLQNNFESNHKEDNEQISNGPQSPHASVTAGKIEDVKEEPIEMTNIYQEDHPNFDNTLEVKEDNPNFDNTLEVKEDNSIKKNEKINYAYLQHQIPEGQISGTARPDVPLQAPQITHLASIAQQEVKDEPISGNGINFSKTPHEIPSPNMNSWQPYWNGYQAFPPNQVTNTFEQDIKPDFAFQHLYLYGQQQKFGNVDQFSGTFSPNQPIVQSTQDFVQPNPWSYFNPEPPVWHGYPFPFHYGQNSYGQQSIPWGNSVKMELNVSNESTSDLGSSFESSENSFNSLDDNADIKPTLDFSINEEILWVPDEKILPKGWKKRVYKSGKIPHHNFFMSPSNEKFNSKSAVLEYMDRFPLLYTKEDKEKLDVRISRSTEDPYDWIPDETLLPEGWKKKVNKNGKPTSHYFFLSPTNQKFSSKTSLLEYMVKNPGLFSESDIDKLKSSMHTGNAKEYTNWDNSDPTLPQGWLKRYCEYRCKNPTNRRLYRDYQYLSPQQEIFISRNAMIAHMKANSYSEDQIKLVFSGKMSGRAQGKKPGRKPGVSYGKLNDGHGLSIRDHTKWDDSDPTLPQGWFKRHSVYYDPNGRKHIEYQYLSPSQKKLTSRSAIVAFMKRSGEYSEDEIGRVLSGKMSGKVPGKKRGPKPVHLNGEIDTNMSSRDFTKWDDSDPTLPSGWFKRYSVYCDPSGREHMEYQYLSPCQNKFTSRKAVLAFMKQSEQYSEDEIELVLSGKLTGKVKGRNTGSIIGISNGKIDGLALTKP